MRTLLKKLCEFLEKKLYDEPTYEELSKELDKTKYRLAEAVEFINQYTEMYRLQKRP